MTAQKVRMLCLAMAFSFHQYTQPLKFAFYLTTTKAFVKAIKAFLLFALAMKWLWQVFYGKCKHIFFPNKTFFIFKLGTKNYNLLCCCCSFRPQNTVENISERPNTIWSNFRLSPLFYSAKNPYIFNFFRQCISLILFCHR